MLPATFRTQERAGLIVSPFGEYTEAWKKAQRKRDIVNFLSDFLPGLIVVLLLVVAPLWWAWDNLNDAAARELAKREAFMSECVADGRKQYECTAMWRQGESNTHVVPVPVVIPMR